MNDENDASADAAESLQDAAQRRLHLAQLVQQRREELRLSQVQLWQNGGPSNSTLTKIESGAKVPITAATKRKLEEGLQWRPGAVDLVLTKDPPPSALDLLGPVERSARGIEALMADVQEAVHNTPNVPWLLDLRGLVTSQQDDVQERLVSTEARVSRAREQLEHAQMEATMVRARLAKLHEIADMIEQRLLDVERLGELSGNGGDAAQGATFWQKFVDALLRKPLAMDVEDDQATVAAGSTVNAWIDGDADRYEYISMIADGGHFRQFKRVRQLLRRMSHDA